MKVLLLDNYDSFSYNLQHYVEIGGADCFVIRNDDKRLLELESKEFDAVVVSPGPQTPKESAYLLEFINKWMDKKPMLGVCLGHQALGETHGARLLAAREPVHGKVKELKHTEHVMFNGMPERFLVCRYHSLILQDIPKTFPFEITAYCADEIMAIAHRSLPIWGVQYHPEAILTEFGQQLINNWLALSRKYE